MGIFQSRPEEPSEWAGLPAEPREPRMPGEVLPPAAADPTALGLVGTGMQIMFDVHAVGTAEIDSSSAAEDDGPAS